jgi:class 3 adenylate cyclase
VAVAPRRSTLRACEPGRILLSQPTWLIVQDTIHCIPKGEIEVKGIHHPVTVYEVDEPSPSARTMADPASATFAQLRAARGT